MCVFMYACMFVYVQICKYLRAMSWVRSIQDSGKVRVYSVSLFVHVYSKTDITQLGAGVVQSKKIM